MNSQHEKSEVFCFVPSYNHAPFVERCLRSVIAQTLSPKKLLVIDDGSNDDSPKIIERVLRGCPFDAELIVRENRGLCATLNQGLSLSGGKYFAYLGSDDFWLPPFLEARARLLDQRERAVLGYGHAFFVDENDKIFGSTEVDKEDWVEYADGDARLMLIKGAAPISSTVFYRRSVIEKIGWNENSRLEDYEMYLKLMTLGDFAFDSQILSAWRHHGYNTSQNSVMMVGEVIEAQNRNRHFLGVSDAELEKLQAQTKFRYARDMLQHGSKVAAFRLAKECWRGADSKTQLAKFALRMFVPMNLINFRRSLRKKNLTEKKSL